jgi:hypothetical protein
MKETAVEWLANELYEKFEMKGDGALFNDLLNKANKMFEQQIINANRDGVDMVVDNVPWITGEQYYNETFKNK